MSKLIDLTGKRFGRLTVIGLCENSSRNKKWKCKCDCGNEVDVFGGNLKRSHTQSCGCISAHEDLTGQKFREFTVVEYDTKRSTNKSWYWICECSCGTRISLNVETLRRGTRKNCGGIAHSDLIGKRFGRLIVLPESKFENHRTRYKCKCDCGNEVYVCSTSLLNGNTQSCGCLQKEIRDRQIKKNTKHGMSGTRIYNIWAKMIERCEKEYDTIYKYYGGRGISVCKEWKDNFMNFYNWSMNNGYTDKLTLDRIDVNGDYCPKNCRWVTMLVQANNSRKNVYIEYNGKRQTIAQWARELNINPGTLHTRKKELNWSDEKCITTPVKKKGGTV